MPGMRSPIVSQVPIFSHLRAQNCVPVTVPHLKRLTSLTLFQPLRQLWYARWEFNSHFAITFRGENLTDQHYQTTIGYPALGTALFCGAEIRF
jgi:hypothetical protein